MNNSKDVKSNNKWHVACFSVDSGRFGLRVKHSMGNSTNRVVNLSKPLQIPPRFLRSLPVTSPLVGRVADVKPETSLLLVHEVG